MQLSYDHFNLKLFNNELPQCLITLQREKKAYGYFCPERFFNNDGEKTDEIALNPLYFSVCPLKEIMQTLVHEMVHLWQHHFGKTGRGGYHNKQWGNKMESIGLMPSSTGQEGGKKTGDKMADYAISGGLFEQVCDALFNDNFHITWADFSPSKEIVEQAIAQGDLSEFTETQLEMLGITLNEEGIMTVNIETKKQTRKKYSCPKCNVNLWGKAELNIVCGNCNVNFEIV